ncbi:GntR family transcriptional regulator [Microbacterium hydrocarbonoxydans]|uniref:GntR family transcriptional regulator n=1 Tax=Microbacterium hydrocarbonoxydans TaxID=273678 RepID=UPI0007BC02A9|nr:GntR family transcriptional regulator [Microbacterium hydrocarbonoxydans]GAT72690.1 bacterial regulatory s, gntR family protein [Microbacterium sp. HM58-2]
MSSRSEERVLESTRAADWLRDAILDGTREAGSRLIERDLATEFGVSRVPVRDALKLLEAEGLVELRPRTWAIVREFTPNDLADLDEVRQVLEPMAFRLAAERHRRDGLDRLRAALEDEQESARTANSRVSRRAAADFHEIVVELADNKLLGELMNGIRSRMRWALAQHDDLQHIAEEHVALYEAIRDRDGDRASALAYAHVDSSRRERIAHAEALRTGTVPVVRAD